MPTDVIIDPTNGQIYWNNGGGGNQESISIKGDALNAISFVGYSGQYSPGSAPGGAQTLVSFTDSSLSTLVPGTTNYELGSGTLRWKFYGSTGDFSSDTLSSNLFSGAVLINGGIAISGNASIGQSLVFYNPLGTKYTGFKAGDPSANTIYTLPIAFPSTGTSVLQSTDAGIMSWVPMTTGSSGSTAANISIVNAATGVFFPLFTNTSSTANGTAGVAVSVDSSLSFDATSNTLIVDGATLGGLGLTTTFASFDIGNTSGIAQTLNFSNTTTGQVLFNFGTASASASTATFFGPVNTNRMVLNVNSSGNVHIQTNQTNARVRLFQNNTTGNVSIFGTSGGTLFLGEDSTTNNADISIKGTVLSGGGGNVRAALFTLATATSNGSGVGGTILFQTSTSGNPVGANSNTLRTRLRIEGAATGTSNLESIIGFGDTSSGTAWTSYLRGVDAAGSNVDAGEIQIQAGRSTGSGLAQGVSFYVSSSGAGAAVLNTPLQIGRFTGTGLTIYSTTVTSSTTTGALIVAGGVGIGGTLFTDPGKTSSISGFGFSNGAGTGNSIILNSAAVTTSFTSGALIVAGGVGIGGTLFTDPSKRSSVSGFAISNGAGTGNSIILNSAAVTTSTSTGALIVTGGVGIGGTLFTDPAKTSSISGFGFSNGAGSGSSIILSSTVLSNTTSSGALIISGGAGIAKSLNIGEGINLWSGANYTGLKSAASTSIQYTLPPTVPSGTGTSFLSSSGTGVMAWVAPPTGGGPSGTISSSDVYNIAYYSAATTITGDSRASGNYFYYNGTNNGLNIAHTDNEFNPTASTGLLRVGTGATNYSTNRKALAVVSTNNAWTDGDLLILGVGNLAANIRFGVDWTGRVQIGTPGTGFTLPATNGTSGQVLTANTDGKATWTTVSGSPGAGSGTVAIPGAQYQVAAYYHSATGASVAGSTTFTNNTSTGIVNITHSTLSSSTSTGALIVAGGVGIGGSLYVGNDVVIRSQNDLVLWNLDNSRFASLQAGNITNNYTLSLPTAQVATGSSVIVTGSDGNQYFAAPGSGIAFSSATANTPIIRTKRPLNMQFAAGYTPLAAGPDNVVLTIPDSAVDGISQVTYLLRDFYIRVETPSAGSSRIQLERSTGTGAFTLAATGSSYLGGLGLTISGAGIYVTTTTTFAGAFLTSGDNLRLNWSLLNATHANFSVQLLLEEV
jgi:hypothetical protein